MSSAVSRFAAFKRPRFQPGRKTKQRDCGHIEPNETGDGFGRVCTAIPIGKVVRFDRCEEPFHVDFCCLTHTESQKPRFFFPRNNVPIVRAAVLRLSLAKVQATTKAPQNAEEVSESPWQMDSELVYLPA